jgi:hypothetical protein
MPNPKRFAATAPGGAQAFSPPVDGHRLIRDGFHPSPSSRCCRRLRRSRPSTRRRHIHCLALTHPRSVRVSRSRRVRQPMAGDFRETRTVEFKLITRPVPDPSRPKPPILTSENPTTSNSRRSMCDRSSAGLTLPSFRPGRAPMLHARPAAIPMADDGG